jgi:site-specific recombinase XerD
MLFLKMMIISTNILEGHGCVLQKKAGLKKVTPHILKHPFAAMLVREGAVLNAVKELRRWSELK